MMPKSKEAPAVGLCKALTVFYCQVDAVVLAIEIPTSGWFLTRAVWESRVKNPGQFFYDDSSFWKLARLQIRINVFLLNIDVMIFGEVRLSIIEPVRRQRSPHKNPFAKTGWQLQLAISIEDGARLFSLGSRNRIRDKQVRA